MAKRFVNERTIETTRRLTEIANRLSISVTTLAVAWSKQHDFVASTIIGVSQFDQLADNLAAADLVLDQETMQQIDDLHVDIPLSMTEDGLRYL